MADQPQHVLERRASTIAQRLVARRDALVQAIAPAGTRPPFTDQLSNRDALTWWTQHRHDDLGAQVLARMQPADVLELDQALGGQNGG